MNGLQKKKKIREDLMDETKFLCYSIIERKSGAAWWYDCSQGKLDLTVTGYILYGFMQLYKLRLKIDCNLA